MITSAFHTAAQLRAKTLGFENHSLVTMPHPLASRTHAEVKEIAADLAEAVAQGLAEHK